MGYLLFVLTLVASDGTETQLNVLPGPGYCNVIASLLNRYPEEQRGGTFVCLPQEEPDAGE